MVLLILHFVPSHATGEVSRSETQINFTPNTFSAGPCQCKILFLPPHIE
jgi:hypothetical protein